MMTTDDTWSEDCCEGKDDAHLHGVGIGTRITKDAFLRSDRAAPRAEGLPSTLDIPNPYRQGTMSWITFEQGQLAALEYLRAAPRAEGPPHDPPHDARDCPECDHWIALRDGSFAPRAGGHIVRYVDAGRDEPPENGFWRCSCGKSFAPDGVDEYASHLVAPRAEGPADADFDTWLRYFRELRDDGHLTEFGRGALVAIEKWIVAAEGHHNRDGCNPYDEAHIAGKAGAAPLDPLAVQEADMCPNCVTPWKCNGPHRLCAEACPDCGHDAAHFTPCPSGCPLCIEESLR